MTTHGTPPNTCHVHSFPPAIQQLAVRDFRPGIGRPGTAPLPSQCTNGDRSFAQVASVVACAMLKDRTMFDPSLTGKTVQREEPGKEEVPELPVNPELVRSTLKWKYGKFPRNTRIRARNRRHRNCTGTSRHHKLRNSPKHHGGSSGFARNRPLTVARGDLHPPERSPGLALDHGSCKHPPSHICVLSESYLVGADTWAA